MAFMDTLYRLERLAHLINRKSTGTREELARKMNVSVRTVDNLIWQLRGLCEVEIYYCLHRSSYCFAEEVIVRFEFVLRNDANLIKGGENYFTKIYSPQIFCGGIDHFCYVSCDG